MNPKTKIRVSRTKLIAAIKKKKNEHEALIEKELFKYETTSSAYRDKLARALDKAAVDARAGKLDKWDPYYFSSNYNVPSAPCKPSSNTTHFDRALAQLEMGLEMGLDEEISITVEDFARYVG